MGEALKALWHDLFGGRDAEPPASKVPADTSYDEVSPEQIRRMNEYAQADYSRGNWVIETIDP